MKLNCLFSAAVATLVIATGSPTMGQSVYPSKPVKIIVPFAAGGSTDLLARSVANGLSRELGQPVFVENRAGASGNIGMNAVAKANPDGYTLLFASSNLTANPAQMKVPFDVLNDFSPIVKISFAPMLLVKSSQLPGRTVNDVVSVVRSHPGKFSYSSSGAGGGAFLAGELFKSLTRIDMLHVPYNGAGPALNDVMSGEIQMTFTTYASARGLLQTSKISAVAIAGKHRLAALPQVPTFEEEGVIGMEIGSITGLLAPANTSPAVVDALYSALRRVAERQEFRAEFSNQGADLVLEGPAEFASFIRKDVKWWADLTARVGNGK